MADCESFEVAIEKHRHGVLSPVEAAELERHLKSCPSCRHYQALARQTESTMLGHAQTLSLDTLDARVQHLHDDYRLKSWVPVLLNSVMGVLLALRFGSPYFLGFIGVGFLTMGVVRLRVALEARQQGRLARDPGDLLAFYRSLLVRRIRRIRVMSVAIPAFAAIWLPAVYFLPEPRDLPMLLIIAVPLFGGVGLIWYLRLKKIPGLRRELEELGGS